MNICSQQKMRRERDGDENLCRKDKQDWFELAWQDYNPPDFRRRNRSWLGKYAGRPNSGQSFSQYAERFCCILA